MKILVTGGAGYIGSHTVLSLLQSGYEVVVADNLSNSCRESLARVTELVGEPIAFYEADIRDAAAMDALFLAHPDVCAVIHFAGLKAVGESAEQPLKYYENNVGGTVCLLMAMQRAGVRRIVFSSSATVYGLDNPIPYTEAMHTGAFNPYGRTKLMVEEVIRDLCAADGRWAAALLRYFNPIGAHESGRIGEDPRGIPNNLMPYITQVAVGRREFLNVFGNDYPTVDGTGVRDYLHVMDLAEGHVLALEKLRGAGGVFCCNLGTGRGTSVLELVSAFERASGVKIPYKIAPRREGDLAEYYADTDYARRELGFCARRSVEDMCADSWRWQSMNPRGYRG